MSHAPMSAPCRATKNYRLCPLFCCASVERDDGTKLADEIDIKSITHPTMLANYNLRGQRHRQ